MPALYLTEQGSVLRHEGERLIIEREGRIIFGAPLLQVDRVLVFGNVQLTTPTIGLLLQEGIEVSFLSARGRYKGRLVPAICKNIDLRQAQYERAMDAEFSIGLARIVVAGKIRNSWAVLGRYGRNNVGRCIQLQPETPVRSVLRPLRSQLKYLSQTARRQDDLLKLLGVEGHAAKLYFQGFSAMLHQPEMTFTTRTRHPPTDPVNALLSLGYTLAGNELHGVAMSLGLDPWLGFLHGISERRPGLPLDLLEEFRAPLVDRFTVSLLNRRVLDVEDFIAHPKGGVTLTNKALKRYLNAWEINLLRKFKHPISGQPVNFRRLFTLQVQAMAKAIECGETYHAYEHRH